MQERQPRPRAHARAIKQSTSTRAPARVHTQSIKHKYLNVSASPICLDLYVAHVANFAGACVGRMGEVKFFKALSQAVGGWGRGAQNRRHTGEAPMLFLIRIVVPTCCRARCWVRR